MHCLRPGSRQFGDEGPSIQPSSLINEHTLKMDASVSSLAVSVFLAINFAASASCSFFFSVSRSWGFRALLIKAASCFLPDSWIQRLLLLEDAAVYSASADLRGHRCVIDPFSLDVL
jgi:hypothetical protein